ncbi:hypothetical protein TNCT_585271 [Trichonephila clavata]|uniref:Uncharacterized protein n=1 Tax=Trichonephila clavata TaxID=2740835 RepID=A0A8X6F0N9_TRICU|nr:hypothetical protein TNCT_585271 [Trichonephila clavata]
MCGRPVKEGRDLDQPSTVTTEDANAIAKHKIYNIRSYPICRYYPQTQLTPDHIFGCKATFATLFKLDTTPLGIIYSPQAPDQTSLVIRSQLSVGFSHLKEEARARRKGIRHIAGERMAQCDPGHVPPVYPNGWIPLIESKEVGPGQSVSVSALGIGFKNLILNSDKYKTDKVFIDDYLDSIIADRKSKEEQERLTEQSKLEFEKIKLEQIKLEIELGKINLERAKLDSQRDSNDLQRINPETNQTSIENFIQSGRTIISSDS